MKHYLSFISVFAVFFSILISSCSKDNSSTSTPQSRKDILTSKKWRPVSIFLNGVDASSTFLPDCEKDDYAIFFTNGSYEVHDGTVKCDASDPEIKESSSWTLSTDENTLTIGTEIYTIISLTSTTSKLKYVTGGYEFIETFAGF